MINRQMKPYILYENQPKESPLGCAIDNYILVDEILAAVNFISYNSIQSDEKYQDCRYSGLTLYKDFDLAKEYKFVAIGQQKKEYLIKSINPHTRQTQLLLQEVCYE